MSTSHARRSRTGVVLAAAGASLIAAMPAGAATIADQRIETPIVSTSSQTDVTSSVVRLRVPMLPGAAAHPAECDWIAYERWRRTGGPTDATKADGVAVLMPGVLEGATAFDVVARNTIREAARRGKTIEVWGIDRRSNCLEDHTGVDALDAVTDPAKADPKIALDYYYKGSTQAGRKFGGWKTNERVLADLGLQQTIEDYNSVLISELPSQPWREKHVICGGHSLGGPLTQIYASWDFDGNAATTADAGYRQCAGFMGFDTVLNGGSTGATKVPTQSDLMSVLTAGAIDGASTLSIEAIKAGLIPRTVNLLGISPETTNLLEMLSVGAEKIPDQEATATVKALPQSPSINDFLKLAGAGDLGPWLFSGDSLRDYRYTYRALLGQIMDDNGAVLGLVRSSFGYFDGNTQLRRNRLPSALGGFPGVSTLIAPGALMLPQKVANPQLTTWRNYDALGSGAGQLGAGVTSPGEEVTDAFDFSRIVHEGPLNLTENYFPIRLMVDQALLGQGSRSGGLKYSMHPNGITSKPRQAIIGSKGLIKPSTADPQVIAPGYEHLDVLTAAERQTSGQPELSSQTFAGLVDKALAG